MLNDLAAWASLEQHHSATGRHRDTNSLSHDRALTQSCKSMAAELELSHKTLYRSLRRMQEDGMLGIDGARLATKP